ncbi:MAG: protein kinase [Kiritimatiellaeota bacterium]|nr:protein kinase [Kiritimatiellota bacterium]
MRFQCPYCRGVIAAPNSDMGTDCRCGHCGDVVSVPLSRVATGSVIADFLILEELGRGGMGIVYLAHQITLDRPAALKILAEHYATDPAFVVDFIKEARAAAKLNHPHIVQAYAVGEDEGVYFFAMEHIDGETMKDFMKREGVVPVEFALEVIQQIAEALDYAWKEQRLIHRDIKPDNIMLTKKNRAKLADLGLARVAGDNDDADSDEVMGTPQYISPEHLTGAEMDVRSDIYSLGATLFHFITGRFAFEGRTATDIARKHLEEQLISPKDINPNIPDSVVRIIFKMMAKDASERYQSAEALVEDIRLARRGKAPLASTGTGKQTKHFSVKKGSGKTLVMKAAGTGQFAAVGTSSGRISTTTTSRLKKSKLSSTASDATVDTELIKLEKERNAKTRLIMLVVGCLCVIIAAVGYFVWANVWKKTSAAPTKPSKTVTKTTASNAATSQKPSTIAPKKRIEPKNTKYTAEADKLLVFAKNNVDSPANILVKFDEFFAEHQVAEYKCDKLALWNLLKIYVPIDEKRVRGSRSKYHERYLFAKKRRKQGVARAREEELKRKRFEERKVRQKRLEEERKRQEEQKLADYVADQASRKDQMRYRSLFYSMTGNYKEAKSAFDQAIKELTRVIPLYKESAKELVAWGQRMRAHIDSAEKMAAALKNPGTKLNGVQIEVKHKLGILINLRNGKATMKTYTGKKLTVPVSALAFKDFKKILKKAESTFDLGSGTVFHYLFAKGSFMHAARFLPADWRDEFKASLLIYIKKKLREIDDLSDDKLKRRRISELFKRCGKNNVRAAKKAMEESDGEAE